MGLDVGRWLRCSLVVLLLMHECTGHLRLTYPPARKYQFDFLDNARTQGPCGMPRGLGGSETNLEAGSTLDIHWHLSFPHQGGFFFEVRDEYNVQQTRYPVTGFEGSEDGTSLRYTVTLPAEPCDGCTFRMVRQATEWSANFLFWSCADVNIVQALPDSDRCSGQGAYENGICSCNRLFTGDKCQFKEECETDGDCGQHGICVDTKATSFPKHQCYCSQGWFGNQCQHESAVTSPPSDMSVYTSRTLSSVSESDVTVHYRIVQDEVEVVLKARTASWMGFGWRPAGLSGSCRNFPDIRDVADNGEADGESEGEGEAEGSSSTVEPEGEAEAETSTSEPEGEAETSTSEPEGEAETSTSEPEGEAETSTSEPEGEAETSTSEPEGAAEAETSTSEPGGEAEAETSTSEPEGEAESTSEPEAEAESTSKPGAPLHPMDCTDLVIGSARGDYSRIGDYYTRDRSTPVHDEYLGGSNSLTAGLVWEEGQHTFMLFRKKLTTDDPADHSLRDELTHVIWAKGQQKDQDGQYNHRFPSALEANNVSIPDFYRIDELKYHGHVGQRGAATLNFYDGVVEEDTDTCARGSCPANACGFDFSWEHDADTDLITFNLTAQNVADDQWIALGFSDDTSMVNTDVIYGGIDSEGNAFVTDGWIFARQSPKVDSGSQDVRLLSGGHHDDTTSLVFTRPRSTGDPDDLDLSQCRYVFFAKGGKIRANGFISQHSSTPIVSAEQICFGCPDETTTGGSVTRDHTPTTASPSPTAPPTQGTTPTTASTNAVTYATPVSVRLPDVVFRETLRDAGSSDFQQLARTFKSFFGGFFQSHLGPKFQSINILAFRQGSVFVDFEVVIRSTGGDEQVHQDVKTAAELLHNRSIASFGTVELQQVSDTYIGGDTPTPAPTTTDDEEDSDLLTEVEIIIIAVVCSLVLAAALVGLCKFVEQRSTSKQKHKRNRMVKGDGSSTSSVSGSSGSKDTMTYGEFMGLDHSKDTKELQFVNSGYDNNLYKTVP